MIFIELRFWIIQYYVKVTFYMKLNRPKKLAQIGRMWSFCPSVQLQQVIKQNHTKHIPLDFDHRAPFSTQNLFTHIKILFEIENIPACWQNINIIKKCAFQLFFFFKNWARDSTKVRFLKPDVCKVCYAKRCSISAFGH